LEKKLLERGRPVPEWVLEGQKKTSCSLKARKLGLACVDEKAAIERILKKQAMGEQGLPERISDRGGEEDSERSKR